MKKRIFSALMALCLAFSISGAAFADVEPTPAPAPTATAEPTASQEPEAEPTAEPTQTPEAKETSAASAGPESKAEPASSTEPQDEQDQTGTDPEQEAPVQTATPETADPASYPARTVEQTVADTGVTVKVDVPAGALPEDATLTTALVGSSVENGEDQAVADVAAELDKADVDYDGFVALDISFVGADNEEIEPLQPVSVNFTLPAALLPEEVDPATLAVQHLAEDETGAVEKVETVADTADATSGVIAVDAEPEMFAVAEEAPVAQDAEITAEFEVEGFSIFTITWSNSWTTGSIDVVCIDSRGKRIEPANTNIGQIGPISSATTLESLAPKIEGYTYKESRAIQEAILGYYTANAAYEIRRTGLGDLAVWQYKGSDGGWHSIINLWFLAEGSIYFVYTKDPVDPSEEPETPDPISPMISKTATKRDDDTYDLMLSVTGALASSEKKLPLDVVFVIDESGSMKDPMGEGDGTKRIDAVKKAIQTLTEGISENENIDARYNIVTFSSMSDTSTRLSWTSEDLTNQQAAQAVATALNGMSPNGGTNYQAGLQQAEDNLLGARPGATTCVIFLTDGAPTYRIWDGYEVGDGNNDNDGLNIDGAVQEVAYLNSNLFYCVGVGAEFSDSNSQAVKNLQAMAENANAGTSDWANAADTESLQEEFEKMTSTLTTITVKDVTINDTLSDNVSAVTDARPAIHVYDGDGTDVTEKEVAKGNISATLNGKTLKLDFDDAYELKENYTYTVTLSIEPSETAKAAYRNNGYSYPSAGTGTGDTGTGTHAGETGFFSNDKATLTYTCLNTIGDETVESKPQTRDYPMPVVQVNETSLTIYKTFAGSWNDMNDAQKADAVSKISFAVKDGETSIKDNITLVENGDGTYSATVDGLTIGKTYTVTETATAPDGYSVTVDEMTKTTNTLVATPASNAVTFTNTYEPATSSLTITKIVTGDDGKAGNFDITVTGPAELANQELKDSEGNGVPFDGNAKATVTLGNNGSITIVGLPRDEVYTVQEDVASQGDIDLDGESTAKKDYYLDKTEYKVDDGQPSETPTQVTLKGNTTVTVTNTYKPYKTLTVKKSVIGEMGSYSDKFDFSARNGDEEVTLIGKDTNEGATDAANYDFGLVNDGTVTLVNLKEGDNIVITEAPNDNRGYTFKGVKAEPTTAGGFVLEEKTDTTAGNYSVSQTAVTVTIPGGNDTDLGTLVFTNEREAVAPTGLESNHTAPYALMVTAAGVAGLALLGSMAARRRRRQE